MGDVSRGGRSSWLHSDRPLARTVARPLAAFLQIEAAGGIALVAAAAVALLWANSPWHAAYETLWNTNITIAVGEHAITETALHWVNDALMALFFLLVGLEIKRELVTGELRDRRAALLPGVAALGGMVVPALIYLAFNHSGEAAHGWGIPMATDIAFALGVVALLGSRVPAPLKVFLLTLAIVDDIGAILVIAVFYTDDLSLPWLAASIAATAAILLMRRVEIRAPAVYLVAGLVLWFCVFESGVHATIAGVVLGLLTPARPFLAEPDAEEIVDSLEQRESLTADDVRDVSTRIKESVSVAERLEHALHPWVSFVILPIFALANAGVRFDQNATTSRSIVIGVLLGLVVGKPVGITVATWFATRLGLATLPAGVRWSQLVGVAVLAGIGFTVSLFITELAFESVEAEAPPKAAVLIASAAAAAAGAAFLTWVARRSRAAPRAPASG